MSAIAIATTLARSYSALDESLKNDWIQADYPVFDATDLYVSEASEVLFINTFRPVQDWLWTFIKSAKHQCAQTGTVTDLAEAADLWHMYETYLGIHIMYMRDPSCIRERDMELRRRWGALLVACNEDY